MFYCLYLFSSLTLLIQIVSFISLLHLLEVFHSQKVLRRSSTDDYTSLLPTPLITPVSLHRDTVTYHHQHSSLLNPVLAFAAFIILDT